MTETLLPRELMPAHREEEEDPRGDGWFVTRSGNKFFPLAPKPEEILIEDIAFALSNVCRFGGHVQFTSVAEHSCMVHDFCPPALKFLGLMHDATEAYLGDCVRPLKQQMLEYKAAECSLWKIIAEKFSLPEIMPPKIKEVDNRVLLTERNSLMPAGENTRDWYWDSFLKPYDYRVNCWPPIVAEREFMKRYNELTK